MAMLVPDWCVEPEPGPKVPACIQGPGQTKGAKGYLGLGVKIVSRYILHLFVFCGNDMVSRTNIISCLAWPVLPSAQMLMIVRAPHRSYEGTNPIS